MPSSTATSPSESRDLGEQIAELAARITIATQRLLTLIRQFDKEGIWHQQGALSCAHWLSWRIGLDLGAAREKVRVARALAELPLIDEAFARAEVTYSKVRALTRVAKPENEAVLLDFARRSTASQTEKVCRRYRSVQKNEKRRDSLSDSCDRYILQRESEDGMARLVIQLRPEEVTVLMKAIETARQRSGPDKTWTSSVDGLLAIAESYLAGGEGTSDRPVRAPIEVIVHREPDGSAHLDDGTGVSAETFERLSCDAAVVEVTETAEGTPLDVGRRRRTIPTAIRRALHLRDDGCRFPGCTNRRYVDGHHVQHWTAGGETKLTNLVELCRRHHRYVHEYGYRIERSAEGELVFRHPRGWVVEVAPPPPPLPDPTLEPAPEIPIPDWDGSPPDYGWLVGTLCS